MFHCHRRSRAKEDAINVNGKTRWIIVFALMPVTVAWCIIGHSDVRPGPRLPTTLAERKRQYGIAEELRSRAEKPWKAVYKLGEEVLFKGSLAGGESSMNKQRLAWPPLSTRLNNVKVSSQERRQLRWMTMAVARTFLDLDTEDGQYSIWSNLIFFKDADTGDHGIGTRYQFNGATVQILDRRDLVLIVEPTSTKRFGPMPQMDLPPEQKIKSIQDYVNRVFRVFTSYELSVQMHDSVFVNSRLVGEGAQGHIEFVGNAPSWFLRGFDWWSDGTVVAFRTDKVLPATGTKYDAKLNGYNKVYGYALSDPRPFNRFHDDFRFDFDSEILKFKPEIDKWNESRWFKPQSGDSAPGKRVNNLAQPPVGKDNSRLKLPESERLKLEAEDEENFRKNVLREKD